MARGIRRLNGSRARRGARNGQRSLRSVLSGAILQPAEPAALLAHNLTRATPALRQSATPVKLHATTDLAQLQEAWLRRYIVDP